MPYKDATGELGRTWHRVATAFVALVASLACGFFLLHFEPTNGHAQTLSTKEHQKLLQRLPVIMQQWENPDLVLVVSGQMHGYVNPCGCSKPQTGGLLRRYHLVELFKKLGWPTVGVDLGEIVAKSGIAEQAQLKFNLSMKSLELMNYRALGLGVHELQMPLSGGLIELENSKIRRPRPLALNLADAQREKELYYELNVRPYEIIEEKAVRLGVMNLIGPGIQDRFQNDPDLKFLSSLDVLPRAMDDFAAQKVEMAMLLYHEYPKGVDPNNFQKMDEKRHEAIAKAIEFCAERQKKNPRIPTVALAMSLTEEPEPAGVMREILNRRAHVIEIGHKGRYVGIVGIWRKKTNFELKYEIIRMDPEWDTPPVANAPNPVVEHFEKYTSDMKALNLLAKAARTPHPTQLDQKLNNMGIKATFVGSETCNSCHPDAAKVWQNSGHSHAFDTLVNAQNPKLRQYDPECVVCHTIGFRYPTGYYDMPDPNGLKTKNRAAYDRRFKEHNEKLENVGCENCHGPGSFHANNPEDKTFHALINPNKIEGDVNRRKILMQRLDDFCQKCHDSENDVHWHDVPFAKKWEKVAHPTKRANQAAQK